MAIRKSPYKVNPNDMDEAFELPERDENEKRLSPDVKVRRARRVNTPAQADERTLRRGSLASLFESNGTDAAHRASRRGDTEIPADALLFGGPYVDDDELEEYAPERRTVTFAGRVEPSQRGFAMNTREKKRRKTEKAHMVAQAQSSADSQAGSEGTSSSDRSGKKHSAQPRKEPSMRLGSLLEESMARPEESQESQETFEKNPAAMSPHETSADAHANTEDRTETSGAGGYTFPSRKKARRDMDSGTLAFPSHILRRGPELDEEENEFELEKRRGTQAVREHGGHDTFGPGAADHAAGHAPARDASRVASGTGLESPEDAQATLRRAVHADVHGKAVSKAVEKIKDARAPLSTANQAPPKQEPPATDRRDIRAMSREERGNALRVARRNLFFPRPGTHMAEMPTTGDASTPTTRSHEHDQAKAYPGLVHDEMAQGTRSGVEKLSDLPDIAALAKLEEDGQHRVLDETASPGTTLGDTVEDELWADAWETVENDRDAPEAVEDEDTTEAEAQAEDDEARDKLDAGAPAPASGETSDPASTSDGTRAEQTKPETKREAPAQKDLQKDVQKDSREDKREDKRKDAREAVSGVVEIPNLLDLKVEANPYGLGPETTPGARVHFARFITWTTLERHVVSLRDECGHFAAPGLLGALEDNNAATSILTILRKAAKKRDWPLNVHRIFVPVVYPDKADYILWKQAANASEQSMVFLHHWLKFASEDEVLSHFGISLPKTRRRRNVTRCLWENRESISAFFEDPRHANCRGLVLREGANLFFGEGSPLGKRAVNYCILRPEWVVDIRPVGKAQPLLTNARMTPKSYLERIQKLLVTTPDELAAAKRAEDRSARRHGQDAQSSVHSGINDGLELILSAHKPYGRKHAAGKERGGARKSA